MNTGLAGAILMMQVSSLSLFSVLFLLVVNGLFYPLYAHSSAAS
jgi:hypothetical protein